MYRLPNVWRIEQPPPTPGGRKGNLQYTCVVEKVQTMASQIYMNARTILCLRII